MGSEWACVRDALTVAAALIRLSPARMRAREVATAICSLQTMGGSSRVAPASSADRAIATPSTKQSDSLNPQSVSESGSSSSAKISDQYAGGRVLTFHDLGVDSRRRFKTPRELTELLDALADKLESRVERLSASSVGLALFGLQVLETAIFTQYLLSHKIYIID